MVENNGSRIVNIDDKKLLLVLGLVFVVGTLFSGSLTGDVARISINNQLENNEFKLFEGGSQLYKGNVVKLERIISNGDIIVQVITEKNIESRNISPGHEIYINGLFITNMDSNPNGNTAIVRVN